jgi:hypothetical protein
MKLKITATTALGLMGLYIYYILLILFVTVSLVDTPESIAINRANGIGPSSGFAIMFLMLSGIGPALVLLLPLLSFWLCKKAKQKNNRLFLLSIAIHIILLLVFGVRFSQLSSLTGG